MNTSRRMQFFVGRLFGSSCSHQSAAVPYVVRSPIICHRAKDLPMTTSFICRNFSIANEGKAEQEQRSELGDDQIPTYKEFLLQLPSQEEYTNALMKALKCGKEDFKKIQKENRYWRSLPIDTLLDRIEAFEGSGVQQPDLIEHSTLIFVDFEDSYQLLSSVCTLLGYNGHELFPLLLLPRKIIGAYLSELSRDQIHLGVYKNRIQFFSDKLKMPVRHFTEMLVDHHYLLNLPINRIIEMMNTLLDAGVDSKDIYKDLWVFKFNVEKAKKRLSHCQEAGLKDVKPWIVRCPDEIFIKTVESKRIVQSLSKGLSWKEFVAKTLNCSVEEVEAMEKYDKRIVKVSFLKTKKTIDFLLSEGFGPKEILHSPQVFCSSIKMIERRLKMMKDAGLEPVQHSEVLRRMGLSDQAFLNTFKKYDAYIRDNSTSL